MPLSGGGNKWTNHVRSFADKKGISYMCAMSDPACSAEYKGAKPSKVKRVQKSPKEKKENITMSMEDKPAPARKESFGDIFESTTPVEGFTSPAIREVLRNKSSSKKSIDKQVSDRQRMLAEDKNVAVPDTKGKKAGRPKKYSNPEEARKAKIANTIKRAKERKVEKKESKIESKITTAKGLYANLLGNIKSWYLGHGDPATWDWKKHPNAVKTHDEYVEKILKKVKGVNKSDFVGGSFNVGADIRVGGFGFDPMGDAFRQKPGAVLPPSEAQPVKYSSNPFFDITKGLNKLVPADTIFDVAQGLNKINPVVQNIQNDPEFGIELGKIVNNNLLPAVVAIGKPVYDVVAISLATSLTGNPVLGKVVADEFWNAYGKPYDPRSRQDNEALKQISERVGREAGNKASDIGAGRLKGGVEFACPVCNSRVGKSSLVRHLVVNHTPQQAVLNILNSGERDRLGNYMTQNFGLNPDDPRLYAFRHHISQELNDFNPDMINNGLGAGRKKKGGNTPPPPVKKTRCSPVRRRVSPRSPQQVIIPPPMQMPLPLPMQIPNTEYTFEPISQTYRDPDMEYPTILRPTPRKPRGGATALQKGMSAEMRSYIKPPLQHDLNQIIHSNDAPHSKFGQTPNAFRDHTNTFDAKAQKQIDKAIQTLIERGVIPAPAPLTASAPAFVPRGSGRMIGGEYETKDIILDSIISAVIAGLGYQIKNALFPPTEEPLAPVVPFNAVAPAPDIEAGARLGADPRTWSPSVRPRMGANPNTYTPSYLSQGGGVLGDYSSVIKHLLSHITDPKEPVDPRDYSQAIRLINSVKKLKGGNYGEDLMLQNARGMYFDPNNPYSEMNYNTFVGNFKNNKKAMENQKIKEREIHDRMTRSGNEYNYYDRILGRGIGGADVPPPPPPTPEEVDNDFGMNDIDWVAIGQALMADQPDSPRSVTEVDNL